MQEIVLKKKYADCIFQIVSGKLSSWGKVTVCVTLELLATWKIWKIYGKYHLFGALEQLQAKLGVL